MKSLARDVAQSFHSSTGILGLAKPSPLPSCPFPTAGVHIPPMKPGRPTQARLLTSSVLPVSREREDCSHGFHTQRNTSIPCQAMKTYRCWNATHDPQNQSLRTVTGSRDAEILDGSRFLSAPTSHESVIPASLFLSDCLKPITLYTQ